MHTVANITYLCFQPTNCLLAVVCIPDAQFSSQNAGIR